MTKTTRMLTSVIFIPAAVAALVGVLGGPHVQEMGVKRITDMLGFVVFFVAFAGMLAAPWWPLPGLKERSRFEKLETTSMIWLFMTLIPKVTWEFGWLFFHKQIIADHGHTWSGIWWSYMDGGDTRYLSIDPGLLSLETASVFFGFVGLFTLWQWYRSGKTSIACIYVFLLIMSSDFWGFYSYLMTEVYAGFPSVATPADMLIKFALTNSYWTVMPWVFSIWAMQKLRLLHIANAKAAA
jgi:hypothetical protein